MIMVELVFDAGYMDLSYGDRFRFRGLDMSENLIEYKYLFFLQKQRLETLRNSFYAAHGYDFKNRKWKDYFSEMYEKRDSKYIINPNFSESDFNETERKNIELIRKMENMKEPMKLSDCSR